jgi:hypothetical protein
MVLLRPDRSILEPGSGGRVMPLRKGTRLGLAPSGAASAWGQRHQPNPYLL